MNAAVVPTGRYKPIYREYAASVASCIEGFIVQYMHSVHLLVPIGYTTPGNQSQTRLWVPSGQGV